jgi:hypothetical protein
MGATLAYIVSRTNMLEIIKSDQYKQFFLLMGDEIIYNKYVKEMEYLNRSGELP